MPRQPASQAVKPSVLPTAKTSPTITLETAKVMLFGPPKVGKTTLAASIDPDRTLFLATEQGLGALSVFAVPIDSWTAFRSVGPELKGGDHPYKLLVIDTVDELLKFCADDVCTGLGIKHPSDLEYGKGWSAVTDEFRLRVGALCSLGLGVWFISHAKDEEIKTRTGTITKAVPTISGKPREWLTGFADFILYAGSELGEEGEQRVLRTAATENFEAGGRYPLPDPLPLDAAALRDAIAAAAPAPPEPEQPEPEQESDEQQQLEEAKAA